MLQTQVEALLQPYQLSVKSSEISLLNFILFHLTILLSLSLLAILLIGFQFPM